MRTGLDLDLPGADEREWLLDGLARLIEKQGYEKFLEGPVLLPIDEHFPDVVESGPHGARTLLRRLGTYAGIGELGVGVTVYERGDHVEFDRHGVGHGGAGAAAWFAGIREGNCEYGVEKRELSDPEELIGTLGHEVAHAFREHHALAVVSRDVEEKLTDVTAVYLGFGVFLLNSSQSFKTGGWSASGDRLLYEKKMRGYLTPPQIALLLAAQVTARATPEPERRAISRSLSPNHAKLFEDGYRLFAEDPSGLSRRLGVPAPEALPLRSLGFAAQALAEDPLDPERAVVMPATEQASSKAFRYRLHHGALYGVLGAAAPIVFAATGLVEGALLLGSVASGALVGYVLGRASPDDRCSACGARLEPQKQSCPGCQAILVGVVSSDDERLAAEEAAAKEAVAYDYFTDEQVSADEKDEARLLTAIYAEWVMTRDLVSAGFRENHPELLERAARGELGTSELFAIYSTEEGLVNETCASFNDAYFEEQGAWNADDYRLLTTANRIRDTRAGYRRVQALLDRRFEEWKLGRT